MSDADALPTKAGFPRTTTVVPPNDSTFTPASDRTSRWLVTASKSEEESSTCSGINKGCTSTEPFDIRSRSCS